MGGPVSMILLWGSRDTDRRFLKQNPPDLIQSPSDLTPIITRKSTHRAPKRWSRGTTKGTKIHQRGLTKIDTFDCLGFRPAGGTTVRYGGLTNPRPSFFEDFDPLEATTVRHRSLTNPRPSIFEDFDPLEATTVGHRG